MKTKPLTKPTVNPAFVKYTAAAVSLILIVVYVWVYQKEPFDGPGYDYRDNQALDWLTLLPAITAATMGLLVTTRFQAGEPPRVIWLAFSAGWCCWVGGELAGMVYDHYYWDIPYPELTLIDLCWSLGYVFFGLALYYQFRLIYAQEQKKGVGTYLTLIASALLLTLILSVVALRAGLGEEISLFALYLGVLYPVFDLVEGSAAIWLLLLFGRGKLGRPWWGLVAFAIADSINIFFWIGGGENFPEGLTNYLYLFSDTVYVGGYLIVTLALLSYYFLLSRGPASRPPENP